MKDDTSMLFGDESKKSEIEILGLAGIFEGIAQNRRSGTLYANCDGEEKYIYFCDGKIKISTSPNRPSILTEGIRRAFHQLDDEFCESLFHEHGETGRPLSILLLEMGVEQDFIIDLCLSQLREEIYDIFLSTDVQLDFAEGEPSEELRRLFPEELMELPISLDPQALLMEAARRLDIWKDIKKALSSLKDIPYIAQDIYEEQLSPEMIHLLSLVDGGVDFGEILNNCRIPYFQMMQLFYEFIQEGCLALRTAEELKEMAEFEEFREDMFKCIKLYERAEELGDSGIDTLSWLAEAYESCGLIGKAIAKYKELGEAYLQEEDQGGAIKAYSRVIAYAPEDLDAHAKYVDALFQKGEFQQGAQASIVYATKLAVDDKRKAIQVLEEAYQHNPLSPEVLEKMATFYCELAENVDAIFTYTTLANLYKSRGLFEDTVNSYHKILVLDSANIEARIELSNTYLLMGQHEEGVAEYKRLGDILTDSGLIERPFICKYLINVCEKIIEFEPTNLSAREWLADAYIYRQEMEKKRSGEGGEKKWQEEGDKAKAVLLELLEFLEDMDKPMDLVSTLQKLVQIESRNMDYRRKLAEVYHALNRYDDATKELLSLGEIAIENGSEYLEQGDKEEAMKFFIESLDALNAILVIDPFHLGVRQKRAELLHQLEYIEDAIEEYKLICQMTRAVNNYHDALTALFHIVELAPEYEPSAFLDMARLCERQNKNDLAINFYKKYARFSLGRGDFGELLLACRRLSVLSPQDIDVKEWRKMAMDIMRN